MTHRKIQCRGESPHFLRSTKAHQSSLTGHSKKWQIAAQYSSETTQVGKTDVKLNFSQIYLYFQSVMCSKTENPCYIREPSSRKLYGLGSGSSSSSEETSNHDVSSVVFSATGLQLTSRQPSQKSGCRRYSTGVTRLRKALKAKSSKQLSDLEPVFRSSWGYLV
jgi:hypothetical protein